MVTIGMVWLVSLAVAQVRVVDAAREAARSLARDDPAATAEALGRRVAPGGSRVVLRQSPEEVRVRITANVEGPGGLFAFLPGVEVHSEAVAAREPR